MRLERVDVADTAVDHETAQAARLGAGREHLAPVTARGFVPDVHDEHRTGGCLRDRDVDREVVGGRALDRERGALTRAPGQTGRRRGAIGRPPLSPSVAAPNAAKAEA